MCILVKHGTDVAMTSEWTLVIFKVISQRSRSLRNLGCAGIIYTLHCLVVYSNVVCIGAIRTWMNMDNDSPTVRIKWMA